MNSLKNLFDGIKKSFTIRKKIDFDEYDLHLEMEPLTSIQELKVLESAREYDGGAYINALKNKSLSYALKNINGIDLTVKELEYPGEDGKPVVEETSLFLAKQVEEWPAALRDMVFEAFQNMNEEVEARVKEKSKFERFTTQAPAEEGDGVTGAPKGFTRVEEAKEDSDLTEVERMNKKIEEEIEEAEAQRAQSDQDTVDKYESR